MLDDIDGYQLQWHFNVLVLIERYFKIHILDIRVAKFGAGRTDKPVPHDFG
jgi:hypothetical protein